MLQLYHFPGNASTVVHLVLEELGIPFELLLVDRAENAQRSPDHLKLNPNGLIPVLIDTAPAGSVGGDPLVLYETAAICLHLADANPLPALLPPFGSKARAHAYMWLTWLSNTPQAALKLYFYPERWADDAASGARIKAHAEAKVGAMLDQLDTHFARHGEPWLLESGFSVADPLAFVLCRWTRGFTRPARDREHLKPWLDRLMNRPALQRVFEREGLAKPWV